MGGDDCTRQGGRQSRCTSPWASACINAGTAFLDMASVRMFDDGSVARACGCSCHHGDAGLVLKGPDPPEGLDEDGHNAWEAETARKLGLKWSSA